ncbi:hypothetical protein BGZ47_008010 [Haplosporangium gracile]|nr:hypothetical protein BGZ47_008010 [Haplosporangium gracile]
MPPRDRQNEAVSLYVSGFKDSTRPSDLATLFEPHGRIADVYIPKDYYSGLPRGFAYIQYDSTSQDKIDIQGDGKIISQERSTWEKNDLDKNTCKAETRRSTRPPPPQCLWQPVGSPYHDEEDTRRVFESGEQFVLDGRKLGLQYAQGRRKTTVDEEAEEEEEEEIVAAPDQLTVIIDQVPAVIRAHDLPPEIAVIAVVTVAAPDVVARTADPAQDPLDPVPALAPVLRVAARLLPVDVATAVRPRPDAARLPLAAALPLPDVALPLLVIALPQEVEALETADPR